MWRNRMMLSRRARMRLARRRRLRQLSIHRSVARGVTRRVVRRRRRLRTGVAQEWKEITATLAYAPIDAVEIRAEARQDWSDVDSFVDTDGSIDDNQYSFALEAIFKY